MMSSGSAQPACVPLSSMMLTAAYCPGGKTVVGVVHRNVQMALSSM